MKVKKISEKAKLPERKSKEAAGYDLFSSENTVVPKRSRKMIHTGIVLEIPQTFFGRIASRSGLSLRKGIETGAGIIDSDYRGEICVILHNHSDDDFPVSIGESIAQIIFLKHEVFDIVETLQDVGTTERGSNGFGSTSS